MAKFHINPETGRANQCDAKIKCRFGLTQEQHFLSKELARAGYEKVMAVAKVPAPIRKTIDLQAFVVRYQKEKKVKTLEYAQFLLQEMKKGRFPTVKNLAPYKLDANELERENEEFGWYSELSLAEVVSNEGITESDVKNAEANSDYRVSLNIPNHTDFSISTDLARQVLRMAPRVDSEWDSSPLRKIYAMEREARSAVYETDLEPENFVKANQYYEKIKKVHLEAKKLVSKRFER